MDQDAKKTALRMIPYGIYELTADDGKGNVAAATVNWVTQTAFNPPLVVVGVKTDSGAYGIVKNTKTFALNMLGKDGKGVAFTFFKPTKLEDGKLSGEAIHKGSTGAPILDAAPASVECKVTGIVEQGDHHIVVAEVVNAHLAKPVTGSRLSRASDTCGGKRAVGWAQRSGSQQTPRWSKRDSNSGSRSRRRFIAPKRRQAGGLYRHRPALRGGRHGNPC
jgi:flavin reductase (DIM6/NTAB) family NADH-FMN oxidoreductase RutF